MDKNHFEVSPAVLDAIHEKLLPLNRKAINEADLLIAGFKSFESGFSTDEREIFGPGLTKLLDNATSHRDQLLEATAALTACTSPISAQALRKILLAGREISASCEPMFESMREWLARYAEFAQQQAQIRTGWLGLLQRVSFLIPRKEMGSFEPVYEEIVEDVIRGRLNATKAKSLWLCVWSGLRVGWLVAQCWGLRVWGAIYWVLQMLRWIFGA